MSVRSTTPVPWRVGFTHGGRLGIWSAKCRADEPDVCDVAAVPDEDDEARAELIVTAVNAAARAVPARLLRPKERDSR